MSSSPERAVRAGVFADLPGADRAVEKLLTAGFKQEQITVICSDDTREKYFREFEHQEKAGTHAGEGVVAGASIGAIAGGLAAIALGAASGGVVPLVLAGAVGVAGGTSMGGFVGAMSTRWDEKELSNYYDQAVRHGQILVAVEEHGVGADQDLALAERIIAEAGAKTIQLPVG